MPPAQLAMRDNCEDAAQMRAVARTMISSRDEAACAALMRHGSKSFFLASRLLPAWRRRPVMALYAFCREADDAIDRAARPDGAPAALHRLGRRLDRIFEGTGLDDPVDRALSRTVQAYALPRALFDALLEGFGWDAAGRRYNKLEDVLSYGARVASSVGILLALIWRQRHPWVLARAAELGMAMQLTNIARDVGADARLGRLYLPRHWFAAANLDPDAWLLQPTPHPAVRNMVRRLLAHASPLYASARAAMPALPGTTRLAVDAAARIYGDLERSIERNHHDSVSHRAYVRLPRKLWLAARAMLTQIAWRLQPPPRLETPTLPEVHFLVQAAQAAQPPQPV